MTTNDPRLKDNDTHTTTTTELTLPKDMTYLVLNKNELPILRLALSNEITRANPYRHLFPSYLETISNLLSLVSKKEMKL